MPNLTPEQQTELDNGLQEALASAGAGTSGAPPIDVDDDLSAPAPPPHHAQVDDEFEDDPNDTSAAPAPAEGDTPAADAKLGPDGKPIVEEAADPAAPPADAKPPEDADPNAPPQEEDDATFAKRLKGKTKERFERMVGDLSGYRAALEAAGLKDPSEIATLAERAQYGTDLTDMVMSTGASSEQFGMALDYLGLLNVATSKGDAASAQKALEMLTPAIEELASIAGVDPADLLAGAADPLTKHPDLLQEVADGDISRKRALEIAAGRTQGAVRSQAEEQAHAAGTAQAQVARGVDWLKSYDAQMAGSDPTYADKRPILDALVANIRKTLPPAQWPEAVQRAYASIPNTVVAPPPPPPPPPRVRIGSVRPAGGGAAMVQQFDDPGAALAAGLAAAGVNIIG